MNNAPFEKTILISQLLLDTHNPRLPEIQENQHDTIRSMANTQGERIVALAEHLVDYGPNPASIPIVMPANEDGFYFVLDGNRRVTALKLLESPSLVEGIFEGKKLQKLKHLSTKFITQRSLKSCEANQI